MVDREIHEEVNEVCTIILEGLHIRKDYLCNLPLWKADEKNLGVNAAEEFSRRLDNVIEANDEFY